KFDSNKLVSFRCYAKKFICKNRKSGDTNRSVSDVHSELSFIRRPRTVQPIVLDSESDDDSTIHSAVLESESEDDNPPDNRSHLLAMKTEEDRSLEVKNSE
ncbi:hypothetical protein WUBG_16534, partial [Wuchereria bancrofti]